MPSPPRREGIKYDAICIDGLTIYTAKFLKFGASGVFINRCPSQPTRKSHLAVVCEVKKFSKKSSIFSSRVIVYDKHDAFIFLRD
ncbi:hypothetical protein BABINDRAFT_106299 [Babjeviella inositovora NRRL Y-12698]|uniref:Uncharacterized protein n=1 Tax=Babjeviella inositovora NRRL Y-12698 TaxID=984486 RepID=A0A1E3QHD1_9ASCO|nr:uncharacterized protein BABINDRAFT_106299 [Babjeviella inositovora NRRL Y-12698]ODQ77008.1 hypothetical protein BABINDRAFT_106299 [Babjeviella inositovora NRRL Y-12698]